ncbi:MAG: ABC transporter ATP-binding protein [Gammaproteobacteria bacterium]|nr:ABC transporter ATP-binding protein [Gammaproteobacteria bacterium]
MADALLDIENLTVDLPPGADRRHAVENLTLSLRPDEILCVVGESGSGKSVMARSVMGLLPPRLRPSAGQVRFAGEDLLAVSAARMREVRGGRISMIFQEPMTALNPLMTIGEQIDEVVEVHTDLPRSARLERILEILDDVRLPDPASIVHAYPHELSGGQRQRAMIAMALILDPAILIADEPTTALDVTTQAQILALIKDLQDAHHAGVIFITHDFGVVAEIADRVAVMQHGRLVEFGTADRVLNRPEDAYTRSLIAAVPSLVPRRRMSSREASTLVDVRDLEKRFSSGGGLFGRKSTRVVHAAKGVSFSIRRGETLGLVGESGSGKSTVARCVVRLVEADSGEVLLDGADLRRLSRREMNAYRKRVQMIFQDPYASLNPRLKVDRLIAQGPMIHGVGEQEAISRARELLHLVGLDPRSADRYPHEFSGGQRQRIGVARALALEPEVLIADEPVSALDVSVQAQVLELLARIREQFHLTVLFITHDLRVAAQVCDSVAVMQLGEIVEHGTTAELFANPRHPYTRRLLDAVPGKDWQVPDFASAAGIGED